MTKTEVQARRVVDGLLKTIGRQSLESHLEARFRKKVKWMSDDQLAAGLSIWIHLTKLYDTIHEDSLMSQMCQSELWCLAEEVLTRLSAMR